MTLLVKNQPTNSLHCRPVKQLGQKKIKLRKQKVCFFFFFNLKIRLLISIPHSTFRIFPLETDPGYLINTIKRWSITQVKLSTFEACILWFGLQLFRASSLSTNTLTKIPDRSTRLHDFCKSLLRICSWSGFGAENSSLVLFIFLSVSSLPEYFLQNKTIFFRLMDRIIVWVSNCPNMTSH